MTQEFLPGPTLVEVVGVVDASRKVGLLLLAGRMVHWGLEDVIVSLEASGSVDSGGAAAVVEMLQHLRAAGVAAYLALGPKGIAALQTARKAGLGQSLGCLVNQWTAMLQ
jgi:ABC-type transporter Mla MlaB component